MTRLGSLPQVHPTKDTGAVDRLEGRGHVERVRDSGDTFTEFLSGLRRYAGDHLD